MAAAPAPAPAPAAAAAIPAAIAAAAAAAAPATPAKGTATPAMGDLFATYNPNGADGGLFAPGYVNGFKPSENAVAAYNAYMHPVNIQTAEALKMPNAWAPPSADLPAQGGGPYGEGRLPQTQTYGDNQGIVDPAALQAAAQGGAYNVAARRAAIAAQLQANAQAQANYVAPPTPVQRLYGNFAAGAGA